MRPAVVAAVAVLVAWPVYTHAYGHGGDRAVPWADLTDARRPLRLERSTTRVFRDSGSLARFGVRPPEPIDLRRRDAVLVSVGPRSSTAYELVVRSVVEERRRVVVTVEERAPTLRRPGRARLTFPYRLITIPATGKTIVVRTRGRS